MENKKTKKSKHGKKNWRKNINITDIEISENKKKLKELKNKQLNNLKNEDLFELDLNTKFDNKNKILGNKTTRNKISNYEQKLIKQYKNNKLLLQNQTIDNNNNNNLKENNNNNNNLDLWGDENSNSNIKNNNNNNKINYPSLVIAHPGQSYNPNNKDLNKLLNKVVNLNKENFLNKEEKEKNLNKKFDVIESESDSDSNIDKSNIKISNNPPVTDKNKLTKREKNLKEKKKKNKLKNKEDFIKKQMKIVIQNELSLKKIQKIQKENELKKNLELKEKEKNDKINQNKIKKGIFDDKDLLENFSTKKIPLRNLNTKINPLEERWDNILKRKLIGDYDRNSNKKRNRKLNQRHILDLNNNDDFGFDHNLEIIE